MLMRVVLVVLSVCVLGRGEEYAQEGEEGDRTYLVSWYNIFPFPFDLLASCNAVAVKHS